MDHDIEQVKNIKLFFVFLKNYMVLKSTSTKARFFVLFKQKIVRENTLN